MKRLECKGSGLPTRKHSDLADKCEDCKGTGKQTNKLQKAMTQEHLTADTVEVQFCSDWLKDEISRLFTEIEKLKARRCGGCGETASQAGYISIFDENDSLRKELDRFTIDNQRLKEDLGCALTQVLMKGK